MAARTKTFWVTEDHWQRAVSLRDRRPFQGDYAKQCVIALALADVFPYASSRGKIVVNGQNVLIHGLFTTSDYALDAEGRNITKLFDRPHLGGKPSLPQQVTITKVV